jgi:hypothetical protein
VSPVEATMPLLCATVGVRLPSVPVHLMSILFLSSVKSGGKPNVMSFQLAPGSRYPVIVNEPPVIGIFPPVTPELSHVLILPLTFTRTFFSAPVAELALGSAGLMVIVPAMPHVMVP